MAYCVALNRNLQGVMCELKLVLYQALKHEDGYRKKIKQLENQLANEKKANKKLEDSIKRRVRVVNSWKPDSLLYDEKKTVVIEPFFKNFFLSCRKAAISGDTTANDDREKTPARERWKSK